ncbi:contact-dependent growth inhibition system immunity protein [Xanthomonas vasicola]|uniref:contact-dependent growth inhibition system immunity protein n=1 Tax=Xanthomonas vasicola TaxID=56459 RepID=UPI0009E97CAF|nr:contact-dependent growth inhibition system immunity protein [Xanthomonas vasicola]MBV7307038.1 CdiI family contact-dependent growth inhibition immunity protein [Xanthomonas vasicola pv. vasculorum]MDO6936556.1 contact-dependent growth inhibition system immunity protein [Xanthomonas vasicola]MDO6940525.1 contact-dependent growth inhibition system immunity protein [Xanthomonas vasicola]
MNDVVKTAWADAKMNNEFIYICTYSGYRSSQADPKGVMHFLKFDASDEDLGFAVLDALAHSRFVLPAPRNDVWIHPEATFDITLYDYKLTIQRYNEWVTNTLERYGYKSKRALFSNLKSCSIEKKDGRIKFCPSHHEKLEFWSGKDIAESDHVTVNSTNDYSEIGSALRLAFSRCT